MNALLKYSLVLLTVCGGFLILSGFAQAKAKVTTLLIYPDIFGHVNVYAGEEFSFLFRVVYRYLKKYKVYWI